MGVLWSRLRRLFSFGGRRDHVAPVEDWFALSEADVRNYVEYPCKRGTDQLVARVLTIQDHLEETKRSRNWERLRADAWQSEAAALKEQVAAERSRTAMAINDAGKLVDAIETPGSLTPEQVVGHVATCRLYAGASSCLSAGVDVADRCMACCIRAAATPLVRR